MMRQMPDKILYNNAKRKKEIRKAVKDIIASTFDAKQFEEQQQQIRDSAELTAPLISLHLFMQY
jgi:hypothetical protein